MATAAKFKLSLTLVLGRKMKRVGILTLVLLSSCVNADKHWNDWDGSSGSGGMSSEERKK